jgi:hypothetical protein
MDAYRTHSQRSPEARASDLLRVVDSGPLTGQYLAAEAAREWAMAATRPTVARSGAGEAIAAARGRVGAVLVAVGTRLQRGRPTRSLVPAAAGDPELAR